MGDVTQTARERAEAVARHSYGKLVAIVAARTGDVAGAEDALSDAFATALAEWPAYGIPTSPEAWLLTVARRKTIDASRRRRTRHDAATTLRLLADEAETADMPLPDDRLALMFACAHPAIDPAIRAPLMLQTVLGFDAATIASAFLVSPASMGQRLVRAKAKIRQAGIPFRLPEADEMADRLASVLDAIYATFTAGWADANQRNLSGEAIWLARVLVALLPDQAEGCGLLALMLYADARRAARRDADGAYVPLAAQDTAQWVGTTIAEAETLLHRAAAMGTPGRYQLEAAIQSAHVARRRSGRTDWSAIVSLYDALAAITGSPVVAINRAVAVAALRGPAAGLAALDDAASDPRIADYQPYWAARADLLAQLGDRAGASEAYGRAIGLEADPAVRRFLQQRQAATSSC